MPVRYLSSKKSGKTEIGRDNRVQIKKKNERTNKKTKKSRTLLIEYCDAHGLVRATSHVHLLAPVLLSERHKNGSRVGGREGVLRILLGEKVTIQG
jgi:hypothetical protein